MAPGIVTVAMAQGAHNIPRMWGDKTIRPQDKVTGVVSGDAAGCKVGLRCEILVWLDCDILIKAALFADIASSLHVGTCPLYVWRDFGTLRPACHWCNGRRPYRVRERRSPFKLWAGTSTELSSSF